MNIKRLLAGTALAATLLVPVGAAHAAPVTDGGTVSPRIGGGAYVDISAAPYAAQISFDSTGTDIRCTGSQISAEWVITAKHCNSSSLKSVRFDATNQGSGGTVRTVAARYPSPTNNDVLLLKLSSAHVGTYIGLASSFPATGSAAKVFGWGDETEGANTGSPQLKTADVKVLGKGKDTYNGVSVTTQSQSGHTLSGDSGGPLVVNGKLVGVLSTSSILPKPNPSDFTRYRNDHASISENLSWITKTSGVAGS
ncbi:S1 family peptidase [Arthrobacter russicus]|uniref:Secreted trypsin-like serine protease n=1 Tax=Arthrobacter russicus TaxID=172040 RepID=A0ABU1JB61_9MICC|nr:trypsin-like serine protease [Arthrobacter russicus]MBQ1443268.1 trypsin-like serine protease [Renibacterium sp.]MDR6269660.1 secreted trypsin-like serine protease [Arthrobacter russicus]